MDVIVLAGGLGTRLRSVVSEVPKCMAPVGGKPFLWYLLHILSNYNVGKVVLSVGYLREVIFDYIARTRSSWPFEIDYAIEETPLGTGGGIRLSLEKAIDDEVLILNGDTFFNVDLSSMLSFHRKKMQPMTVALKPMQNFDRYGNVDCENGIISAFHEKQPCEDGLINGGIYLVQKSQLNLSELPEKFSFETEVLQPLASQNKLAGFACDEHFIDIGIPEDYTTADKSFPTIFLPINEIDIEKYETIFLDRDGTINTHILADYVRTPDDFVFLPNVVETIAKWSKQGKRIVVVTNQRGVGRGKMTESDLHNIHLKMKSEIESVGGKIDAIFYSTGIDESDMMRKPNIGMFSAAKAEFPSISTQTSLMIGDGKVDELFARNVGMDFVRLV